MNDTLEKAEEKRIASSTKSGRRNGGGSSGIFRTNFRGKWPEIDLWLAVQCAMLVIKLGQNKGLLEHDHEWETSTPTKGFVLQKLTRDLCFHTRQTAAAAQNSFLYLVGV